MENAISKTIERYRPYAGLIKPVKKQFILGLLFGAIAGAASGFGLPFLLYKALPVILASPPPDFWVLVAYISIFPLAMTVRAISGFFNIYLVSYAGMRILLQIQRKVHERLQWLPLSFFHKNTVGDLMSRVLGDATALQQVLTVVANDLVVQPMTVVGAVGALIYLSMKESETLFLLLFVGTIVVIIFPIQYLGRRQLKRAKQVQKQGGDISRTIGENLSAVREIRAFNLQEREIRRFGAALDRFCHLTMKVIKYDKMIRPGIELMGVVGVSVAVVYMRLKGVDYEAVALLGAFYFCYEPTKKFGAMHMALKRGEAALERIEYILHEPNAVPEPENPVELGEVSGRVEFDNVSFRYIEDWVLRDVNLSFSPGTIVALVGPSGAGKTTIADLIPRFYDVQKGSVRIDGKDVRDVSSTALRAAISVVSQDTFLFNETILDNIRLGNPEATDEQVHAAAKHAFAHDFILELEKGYDTVVGERGTRLSGGQKQRIAIARAFLKSAPILILDEATSALDSESEEKIQRALEKLVRGKTVFMIAHRFATIKMADEIVVMEDGIMRAHGPHKELYASDSLYKNLYDQQFLQ
jgi:subfamily B ATP-binding cassette protein MsbA